MEKVLKDGKLYSLIEFRDKIYEDLDLSKSDLTTLLCAILIASIWFEYEFYSNNHRGNVDFSIDDTYPWSRFCVSILDTKLLKKSFKVLFYSSCSKPFSLYTLFFTFAHFLRKYGNYC